MIIIYFAFSLQSAAPIFHQICVGVYISIGVYGTVWKLGNMNNSKQLFLFHKTYHRRNYLLPGNYHFIFALHSIRVFKVNHTPLTFCHHFAKGDNFCRHEAASLETFQKWELLLKERICSHREQILSFTSSPSDKGGK